MKNETVKELAKWLAEAEGEIQTFMDYDRDGYYPGFWDPEREEGFTFEVETVND